MLEKLRTDRGESSLLIILVFTSFLLLILLPTFSLLFDRGLVKLAIQDITDQIDMSTFIVYNEIDLNALSRGDVELEDAILIQMNDALSFNHPQIHQVKIDEISYDGERLILTVEMILNPTLYRSFYHLDKKYSYQYTVVLPIDGESL